MNILITGASGFIGAYIVDYALGEGLNVLAAIRKTSSKQYLQDERITFIELDFANRENLSKQLAVVRAVHGRISYVIHNAGVTKVLYKSDYDRINYSFTKNLADAFIESNQKLKKFVFVSSLSAAGPGEEGTGKPIKASDTPNPVTAYGRSKLKTEVYLASLRDFPYVIMRPPPVFGPRDRDMFTLFQLIQKKLEIYIGGQMQHLSLIYVKDLAAAIIKAALSAASQRIYFISDNQKYSSVQFSESIKRSMGIKTRVIKLPLFLAQTAAFISESIARVIRKPSPFNTDKMNELICSNWLCDAGDFYNDTGFKANYTLSQGIEETINWYKKEKWL